MIEVVLERCAGIDVGKRYVVACLLTGSSTESPRVEKRQYEATVGELERLRQWLVGRTLYACGGGEHWLILETGVQCVGGECDRGAGQSGPCSQSPRP